MTLREQAQQAAKQANAFETAVAEITDDLKNAAAKYETLSYQKGTSEDRLFNFVKSHQEFFESEGLQVNSDGMNVYLSWV
ncbi:hypothetical protein JOC36_000843 [Weissella uvarum]|uniref:hypothetical protein n=1 Tax=Lactobacillaceae TaxID=33958 RepID=UPI00195F43A4|nr:MULTISPECIES: hypothetical protein [Lactobacillaceae]MBM7617294.1 hypothetical protein [Weissella uvarum]MCM0595204.1 hypothetical protein [Weissella uvarum]MCM0601473.1 hypothetical protein [Periweissella ghanensis]